MTDHLNDFTGDKGCPKCNSFMLKPVKYTWWGGVLGPKLLHHTKCEECKYTFNKKTRKSNTNNIIIYSLVLFIITFFIFFTLFRKF